MLFFFNIPSLVGVVGLTPRLFDDFESNASQRVPFDVENIELNRCSSLLFLSHVDPVLDSSAKNVQNLKGKFNVK